MGGQKRRIISLEELRVFQNVYDTANPVVLEFMRLPFSLTTFYRLLNADRPVLVHKDTFKSFVRVMRFIDEHRRPNADK